MKYLLPLLAVTALSTSAFASAGPGPWSIGSAYPGYLNGKYMGVVTGNNIAGVLGFALLDGAPPFRKQDQQTTGDVKVAEYQDPHIDITQNYFAIFVEGRTYTGLTTAGIDTSSKTVAGALQGTDPIGVQAAVTGAPGPGDFAFNASDALSIINRGLSGGFVADIKNDKAIFKFSGSGELSTPANQQSYQIQSKIIGLPAAQTNEVVTGEYQTTSTSFDVSGIRTSYSARNPVGTADAQGTATTGP